MIGPMPIDASPCCAWAKLARKKNPPITASTVVFAFVLLILKRDLLSVHTPRMRWANQWDSGVAHALHLNLGLRIWANSGQTQGTNNSCPIVRKIEGSA